MLNFASFINSNSALTAKQKTDMLEDFCQSFNQAFATTQEKTDFFNQIVTKFIAAQINRRREDVAKKAVNYEVFSI